MSLHIERYNSIFEREISKILQQEIKDPNIKFVTVTGCEITNDLSYAKVYVTVLDDDKKNDIMKSLDKAKSYIRGQLSKKVEIRHTPELRFIFDKSVEYGNNIERIINNLHDDSTLR